MSALVMERSSTVMTATAKMNGIECLWDGTDLVKVEGHVVIPAPEWFTRVLPAGVSLLGYLTLGGYQGTTRHDWANVRFHIFESPDSEGGYSKRMKRARRALVGVDHVRIIDAFDCVSIDEMVHVMGQVVQAGGLGLIVRDAAAEYGQGGVEVLPGNELECTRPSGRLSVPHV